MSSGTIAHRRERMECCGRTRAARGSGTKADRPRSDENGNRDRGAICRYHRKALVRGRGYGVGGTNTFVGPCGGHHMITSEAKLIDAVNAIYDRLESEPLNPVWISLIPREQALARAQELEGRSDLPLAGKTFAVKDNFDVAGMPTTAGCPAFSYSPAETATVVRKLEEAGALL